jgi:hypothetical protein
MSEAGVVCERMNTGRFVTDSRVAEHRVVLSRTVLCGVNRRPAMGDAAGEASAASTDAGRGMGGKVRSAASTDAGRGMGGKVRSAASPANMRRRKMGATTAWMPATAAGMTATTTTRVTTAAFRGGRSDHAHGKASSSQGY